jgi:hypothetical protein
VKTNYYIDAFNLFYGSLKGKPDRTIPGLSIHYGQYRTRPTYMTLAAPPHRGPRSVRVLKTEEKGSDVNLASYLLLDAFREDCEVAIVVSNDADLKTPIELAISELGIDVGVLNPHPWKRRSRDLKPTFLEEAFRRQNPQVLAGLMEAALIQSGASSNAIEQITAAPGRVTEPVQDKTTPESRSEEEISGYRKALDTIHSSAKHIPLKTSVCRGCSRCSSSTTATTKSAALSASRSWWRKARRPITRAWRSRPQVGTAAGTTSGPGSTTSWASSTLPTPNSRPGPET